MRWLVTMLLAGLMACPFVPPAHAQGTGKLISEKLGTFTANGSLTLTDRDDIEFMAVGTWGGATLTVACAVFIDAAGVLDQYTPNATALVGYNGTVGSGGCAADCAARIVGKCKQVEFTLTSCVGCNLRLYTISRENRH